MVRAKNYEPMSTFIEIMQKKTVASFFPDTVYIVLWHITLILLFPCSIIFLSLDSFALLLVTVNIVTGCQFTEPFGFSDGLTLLFCHMLIFYCWVIGGK